MNQNRIRITKPQLAFSIFNVLLMSFLMIVMLYPLMHVLFASFSKSNLFMAHTGILLRPVGFSLAAYRAVFSNKMIPQGYMNTLFVVTVGTTINIMLSSFGAYYLSRRTQTANKLVSLLIIFTMFFSGGMIPIYLNVSSLGLADKLWSLIIPNAINTFYMLILRTAFLNIPESLEESAMMDGANHITILFKLYMPLSSAVLAVMVLYYGVDHWNAWFNAMLYIRNRDLYPLQLILREILISNDTSQLISVGIDTEQISETIKHAVIITVTTPVLLIYPFLQKYFVKGALIGAVKG